MQVSAPGLAQGGSAPAGLATGGAVGGAGDGMVMSPEAVAAAAKGGLPDLSGPVDMEQLGEIMSESSRLVKENPAQAALLIRYWLNEGQL